MVSKFSDVAVGLSADKLGFRDYADGVIATLESISKEDTPFTIGIFGSWGSGKTSFMQIMQELLESRGYETIFFKSWVYSNEEKPWIPFMIKVVDELFEDGVVKKDLIRNIFLFSTDVVLQKYSQGMVSTGIISNLVERSRKRFAAKNWLDKDTKTVIERVTKIEEFKKELEKKAEKSTKGKIVIFIDDLDRISEEKIVDFLDSLKIFLDIRGCIFVLGCDYKILKNALKHKHKEDEGIYKDYFDKIVQTEFYIPKISEQAIKKYLQFLTGWDDKEIEECTQLVIHSIGGNPRKIKRVVNATMLIKSVFEMRLATFLQAFERPEPHQASIEWGVEGKEGAPEEPMALKNEITRIFTPAEVFYLLFDKKVLFKLVCMREQWFTYYEDILSEEKKQDVLISLQDLDFTTDLSKLLGTAKEIVISELLSVTKEQGDNFKKHVENFPIFLNDYPRFQGVEDLKTYLTLLEISSPEAGISLEYAEPEKLPINLFNRYMLFERINKGKVEETIIKEKIKQEDWKGDLSSYHFFSAVLSAFGYDNLLRDLFKNDKIQFIAERIKDITSDPKAIGGLLYNVSGLDKETASVLLNQTKDTYADKIRASTDLGVIGGLLYSVSGIDKESARELFNQTKDTYANKIRDSTDLVAIGLLLYNVSGLDKETASVLLNQTKDTYADRIIASTDPTAIWGLLYSVSVINRETASVLLNQTKDKCADKIRASTDLGAIWGLLDSVSGIDKETASVLLNQTKDTYVDKIRVSTDLGAIRLLLDSVSGIDKETASVLLNQTKDTYANKIRDSTDLGAIRGLLSRVNEIEEETASVLLNQTKDTYADKIRASTDPKAIGGLLYSVSGIDKETASVLSNQIKDTYVDKIIASTDPGAIGGLLYSVSEIDKETARGIINQTKDTYADKILASTDPGAIGLLLYSVSEIDKETASVLINQTKDTYADKIRASTDPAAIGLLLKSVSEIHPETAEWLEKETKVETKEN